MPKFFPLIVAFLFLFVPVFAQQNIEKQVFLEQLLESFANELSDEAVNSILLDDLERIIENPIDINTASRSDLEKLPILNMFQIENLIEYRIKHGALVTINELLSVDGFNESVVEKIKMFTFLSDTENDQLFALKHEINFRANYNNSGTEVALSGLPKMLLKYRSQKGDKLQVGFVAENDAGEDFFSGSNKQGFDFYSGFVNFTGKKYLRNVFIGDFNWGAGQGLVHGMGFGSRKSANVNNIRTIGQGFRGVTSSEENSFLRGIASTFDFGNLGISAFVSSNKVDANITSSDLLGSVLSVSSLQTTGYHISENEIADEDALQVSKVGGNVTYTKNRLRFGLSSVFQRFNAELVPLPRQYNKYYFSGNNNFNFSTDFLWVHHRFNLFGEAAISKSAGKAVILGYEAQPSSRVSISVLYRNYAKNYHSIGGNAFGESGNVCNEHGLYAGLSVLPIARVKLSAYFDSYSSHWIRFTSNHPVHGTDYFVQADYAPTRNVNVYIRYKTESFNEQYGNSLVKIKSDAPKNVSKLRVHSDLKVTNTIQLHFRTEWAGYQKADSSENGYMIFAGISASTSDNTLSGSIRFAFFGTDSYNTRIYAYENDMPQSFYVPAYYGHGNRLYTNLRFKITDGLTAYFKYSLSTVENDKMQVGSELLLKKSELKFQLKYRF